MKLLSGLLAAGLLSVSAAGCADNYGPTTGYNGYDRPADANGYYDVGVYDKDGNHYNRDRRGAYWRDDQRYCRGADDSMTRC